MKLSPDQTVFWEYGFFSLNLTIVTTWGIMLLLVISAKLITRKLKSEISISRWQCFLEMLVTGINQQIKEVGLKSPEQYIGFIGTLFLFIAVSNLLIILPWYEPPTGSLSTTAALAISVLFAVPFFGIEKTGFIGYLKTYVKPTFIMLPFNIISEISRTLALTIRLFGNI
ncbi:MAG: F-type H+-transporting ATPase subunit a, partial [Marivirga sp.]